MTRSTVPVLALAAGLLAVPAAPALAAGGGFTAPVDVGPGGAPSYGFGVPATGPSGEIAVLAVRTRAHSRASTVLLRRTDRRGRLGTPLVLSRSAFGSSEPALTMRSDGDAVAAWLAYVPGSTARSGNRRVRAARVPAGTRSGSVDVRSLTGGGSSAYSPTFVPGVAGPLLAWARRTGPLQTARWRSRTAIDAGTVDLPLTGVELTIAAAGAPSGRGLVAFERGRTARLAVSGDGGRSFGPIAAIDGSQDVVGPLSVSVDREGFGAVAWADRAVPGEPARILAAVVPPGDGAPSEAAVIEQPATAPGPPLVAAQRAGALVAWTVTTRRAALADNSNGVMRVARLGAGGREVGASVPLGGPGERGRVVGLVPRAGDRAQAFWVTRSRALRAQVIGATGRPGRAVTLDRGIDTASVRVAGSATSATAVTWTARGRLRLASKPR